MKKSLLVFCVCLLWWLGTSGCSKMNKSISADLSAVSSRVAQVGDVAMGQPAMMESTLTWSAPGHVLPQQLVYPDFNTESYENIAENPFLRVAENPLSTFSIDVDTASYSNLRRFLDQGMLPPKDAVRIEELINYFDYDYAPPSDGAPFAFRTAVATCPWNDAHRLARIAIKGREIERAQRPPSNLVFLLDVSGSMNMQNKLPLVQKSMGLLVSQLQDTDSVALVVYAGASGLVLPPTRCDEAGKKRLQNAIDDLTPHGSTQGSAGIQLAYDTATEHFIKGGTNRVVLCTDGDFNVGITNEGDLTDLIEEKAKTGVFLSVLGFGMGNLKDSTMELLADKGNGNYGYIDTYNEARKLFVEQLTGTLITIAKDVKIQIEFNPVRVAGYRLLGYENRLLRDEDFDDDTKDAGEIGAGHTVTALYELVPAGTPVEGAGTDPLVYQQAPTLSAQAKSDDLLLLKLRYKEPDGAESALLTERVPDKVIAFETADEDFRFAVAVAEFGMLLRESPHKGNATYEDVIATARAAQGEDASGYRSEFVTLVHKAMAIGE